MTRSIIAIVLLLVAARARADVPADVTVLFEQGVKDMNAGNTEIACKQIAAALSKFQDSGIEGTLAECYTKLGKIASAWTLWKSLADTAPVDMRPFAAQNAASLEPRLPRYAVRLAAPIAGLVVTINDSRVADPTLPTSIPVDPGPFVVIARAPGHEDWTVTLQASEGATTTIDIPALKQQAAPPPPPPAVVVAPRESRTRRTLAYVVGGIGVASLGVGAIYGLSAASTWSDSKAHCADQRGTLVCDPEGAGLVNDTIRNGNVATVLLAVGAVAAGTGAYLWFTSRPRTERRLAVVPGPSGVAISMSGRF